MSLYNLSNAIRSDQSSGLPLKTVFRTLTNAGAVFRRGQLVLIGAAPGVGKSIFALTLIIRAMASGIYFSADSGPGTQLSRSVSLLTGRDVGEVTRAMERGHTFEEETREISRIWWSFDAGPSLDVIEQSAIAHAYLGAYPEVIVLDNLLNIDSGDADGNEYKAFENTLLFSLELARTTGACVIVLTHLTGEYEDGTTVPPLSALRGKVSKVPELILNLYREEDQFGGEDLGVAIVKNRGGKASAAGRLTVSLKMDLSRMLIEDHASLSLDKGEIVNPFAA